MNEIVHGCFKTYIYDRKNTSKSKQEDTNVSKCISKVLISTFNMKEKKKNAI